MTQDSNAQLPSMPGTVVKLLQMFADPDVSINDVVGTLKTDPALTGRILKAANSSTVGAACAVRDIKRAAMLLGKKTVSTLALSFSLADKSMESDEHADLFRSFWNQSFVTGIAASTLAKRFGKVDPDEAFMVGLLSRIGRLGALSFAAEQFAECTESSRRNGCSLDALPIPEMDMSCDELTLQYMRAWNLPETFLALVQSTQAAAQADRNSGVSRDVSDSDLTAANQMRAAGAVGQFVAGENTGIALATIHELMSSVFDNPEQDVDLLIEDVLKQFAIQAEVLQMDSSILGSPAELHSRAMAHLVEITMAPEKSTEEEAVGEMEWLKRRVTDLTHKLTLDSMTNIYNRSYFDTQLEKRISICKLTDHWVSVVFVDVNEFKQVNDIYGHDVGDEVICAVANKLKSIIRAEDVVARYGGDEFVILCEMSQEVGIRAQAERITEATNNMTVTCHGKQHTISLAIGGAAGKPDNTSDFGVRLLRQSDEAMYEAKQSRCSPVTRMISEVSTETVTSELSLAGA